jgi:transglutaminase-like putative cysteine protease
MDRRDFVKRTAALSGMAFAPGILKSTYAASPAGEGWTHFEMVTKVSIAPSHGRAKVWLPIPTHVRTAYQIPQGNTWKGSYSNAALFREPVYGAEAVYAQWDDWDAGKPMQMELVSKVSVKDRTVDAKLARPSAEEIALYLKATPSSPTDGIVLATALKIAKPAQKPMEKAQAVYNWILENGVRDPNITGCGTGDVVAMLESGNISGKCADLNGLFVALVRALGVPARDVYGIRAGDSKYYKTLGKVDNITTGQHCRAEFYVAEAGWIPVDPADVLKVSLEEKLAMESPQINAERKRQFGSWEGNWVAYNTARDFKLNPAANGPVEFFMYPRAETEKGVLNHLDPKTFSYEIRSRNGQA